MCRLGALKLKVRCTEQVQILPLPKMSPCTEASAKYRWIGSAIMGLRFSRFQAPESSPSEPGRSHRRMTMVGGTVIEVVDVPDDGTTWVNVEDQRGDRCSIYVEHGPRARCIEIGDSLWWHGDWAFWTLQDRPASGRGGTDYDIRLRRLSASQAERPIGG